MSKTKWIVLLVIIVIAAGAFFMFRARENDKEPKFSLEKLQRGDVTATVTATGTLAALTTVKVGSQVSGIISQMYADFNSQVTRGQLLAELDPTTLQAQLDQRNADLERAHVEERNSRIAYERAKNLMESNLLSESEYDIAYANLRSAEAAVKQATAMRVSEQFLTQSSPIDGVVVERQYDSGQR
jgi:HlyD family secretion protein